MEEQPINSIMTKHNRGMMIITITIITVGIFNGIDIMERMDKTIMGIPHKIVDIETQTIQHTMGLCQDKLGIQLDSIPNMGHNLMKTHYMKESTMVKILMGL